MAASPLQLVMDFFFKLLLGAMALIVFGVFFGTFLSVCGGGGSIEPARRAQAKNDVVQIATAVTAYECEYGRMPATNSGVVGGEVLAALMGAKSDLNPRQITFLEVETAKKNKSGIRNGVFVDPWGGAYQIAYDHDGDNRVVGGTNHMVLAKKVAVWNDPRLGRPERDEKKRLKRSVNSWE
jgi:hypothetical protein